MDSEEIPALIYYDGSTLWLRWGHLVTSLDNLEPIAVVDQCKKYLPSQCTVYVREAKMPWILHQCIMCQMNRAEFNVKIPDRCTLFRLFGMGPYDD
jgi:hypothetical protein